MSVIHAIDGAVAIIRQSDKCFKLMKVLKNNMGRSFLYARQNTGLLWHTAVRSSVHASHDNISHLFPLLLIVHVVTYIVQCIDKRGSKWEVWFKSVWKTPVFIWYIQLIGLKKCSILITVFTLCNWPSIVTKGEGGIMAQLFILSYSDAVSFRDIRCHLGTIPSIVTFYICTCCRRQQ
jgi:hypothetical protein